MPTGLGPLVLSDRIGTVPPSSTVALSDRVKRKKADGEDVIDLSVGEPDFPSPQHVVKAAEQALHEGKTTYGPSRGIPELREAVAKRHRERRATPCEVENVMVTPAKHALLTFFLVTVDPGDEVIIPSPAWVSYAPQVRLCGGEPIRVERESDGSIDVEKLVDLAGERTRAVVLNSPSNPLGAVQGERTIRDLLELCRARDTWLVSDEVYAELTYDGVEAPSPAALQQSLDNVAIVDGVSKSYAMTGWRIGWLIGPAELMDAAVRVQQHSVTHPTLFAQYGAVEALAGDQTPLEEMRAAFAKRRKLVVDGLTHLGATFPDPRGAFYAFPRFPSFDSGEDLSDTLLEEAGVAVTPGEAFGPGGEGHVRLSYAASEAEIEEALERIAGVVED